MMINQTDRSRTLWRAELVTGPEAPDLMKFYFLEEALAARLLGGISLVR